MNKKLFLTALLCFILLLSAFPIVSAEGSSGLKTTLIAKRGLSKDVASKAALSLSSYEPVDPYLDDGVDPYLDDGGGTGGGGGDHYTPRQNRMNILLAGDEEAVSTLYTGRSEWDYYGWVEYSKYHIGRAAKHFAEKFGITISVVGAITWDSDDTKRTPSELLWEMYSETGFYSGMYFNGQIVHVLAGVTMNPTDDYGSTSAPEISVVLLRWQAWWCDDNTAQHELSHLYEYPLSDPHHCSSDDCVLAGWWKQRFVWGLWEDGVYWIILAWVQVADLSNNYCAEHYNVISAEPWRYQV